MFWPVVIAFVVGFGAGFGLKSVIVAWAKKKIAAAEEKAAGVAQEVSKSLGGK